MEQDYLDYYGIPGEFSFRAGEFNAGPYRIWSWSLEPESWTATVIVLHGFLDHSLTNRFVILELLRKGYRVIAGDMPGHGRSGGVRGGIAGFEEYDLYFENLLTHWEVDPAGSFALGHSTGSAILINYCRQGKTPFRGMVFAAPLVKMNSHSMLDRGIDLAHDWMKMLPAGKNKTCKNKSFLKFRWSDPLGVKRFSLDWIKSMVNWNREWVDFKSDQKVLVLQGKKDNVVEWKTNIPILENCLTNGEIHYYKKGRHHILNEGDRLRHEVFKELFRYLEENS
ncbi:MAG: alpha/beta hydrolase [Spirochaetales bacterium]|nr:alpha/beta hydrolase [Spirochaetales bacterium]